MKKFLLKTAGFAILIFVLGIFLLASHKNQNYASPQLNAKLKILEEHPEFNLYFIGSSKINNQINSQTVDKQLQGIKSYNLGANGGFNLENFQVLDYILNNSHFKPKFIVLELQDKLKLTRLNLNTERSFGVFNFENTKFATRFQLEEKNYKQVVLGIYSFILNLFHFEKNADGKLVNDFYKNSKLENQGFVSLDDSNQKRIPETELKKEIDRRLLVYNADNNRYSANKVLVEKINDFAEKCKKKGILLIMVIPGPAEPDAKRLNAYDNSLKVPVINLLNPEKNPEFYSVENRWDYGHLNKKGAEILSKKTAENLKPILK